VSERKFSLVSVIRAVTSVQRVATGRPGIELESGFAGDARVVESAREKARDN
jgi:hypothetical protein